MLLRVGRASAMSCLRGGELGAGRRVFLDSQLLSFSVAQSVSA